MPRRIIPVIIAATALLLVCSCCGKSLPRIGISTSYNSETGYVSVNDNFADAVLRCGGIPVILPMLNDSVEVEKMLDGLDGIIFSGGEDMDPRIYGEDTLDVCGTINGPRDTSDLLYIRGAIRRGLPVLGICRGHQLLNVAMGGTLYQDLPTQLDTTVHHDQAEPRDVGTHLITVTPGTRLAAVLNMDTLRVNSFHHQAVKDLAPGLRAAAVSPDGVVEAEESVEGDRLLGVQFHPECLYKNNDTYLIFFEDLIRRSKEK